jgi:hypothetical protein
VQAARGSDNPEIREIGEATFLAASSICPALIHRADPDDFEPEINQLHDDPTYDGPVNIVSHTLPVDQEFNIDVRQMYGMNEQQFDEHMAKRGARQVPTIFKRWHVEMDITMDWGAYRDLQRHRRCEQWAEPLSTNHGYELPHDVVDTELEPVFEQVFQAYRPTYYKDYGLTAAKKAAAKALDLIDKAEKLTRANKFYDPAAGPWTGVFNK